MKHIIATLLLSAPAITSVYADTYKTPKLNDRTIDACIRSYLYPEAMGQQCTQPAQKMIADAFCRRKGRAVSSKFETKSTGQFQKSFKFVVDRDMDGKPSAKWVQDDTGGAIFTEISCSCPGGTTKVAKWGCIPNNEILAAIKICANFTPPQTDYTECLCEDGGTVGACGD